MTIDPRDSHQQRREAMTDWEHGLPPKTERHWLLWLALAVLLVFVAWRSAEWLLASGPQRAGQLRVPRPAVRLPAAPPLESYGVIKCLSATGKAEYSDGPCPAGSKATTVWVQPDVNLADGMSPAEREASMRNNSVVAAQVQQHERRVAQNPGRDVLWECAALDAHIKSIDGMARQPQPAWRQDELTRDRKESRDRQFRMRCQ